MGELNRLQLEKLTADLRTSFESHGSNDHSQIKEKHPLRGVFRKSCSENMQQMYRRTPMSKCDFNKFAWTKFFYFLSVRIWCMEC